MQDKSIGQKILGNQFLRFIISAGIGFLVDVCSFNLLFDYLFKAQSYRVINYHVSNYILSFSISYCLGVIVNFLITRYLVFSESKLQPTQQFLRFVSVAFIGYFANLAILKIMVVYLHMYPPIARPAAALSLFFASFFIHKLFSFNLKLRDHAGNHNPTGN
ncbi:GtrA family protein [Mucilaginibacter agri]|uniref:GtrA family protein n=1 Tax=Mucilaginibacter agri TaxID=2695265 RepID=A0A966DW58_9SPHI|nr:GtrA family protein [Mucilaginibacter agri]NCD72191.1 GtrA family protein [Mucilaginibacter agri]